MQAFQIPCAVLLENGLPQFLKKMQLYFFFRCEEAVFCVSGV